MSEKRPVVWIKSERKWYCLQVTHPDGRIESVEFPDEVDQVGGNYVAIGSPYVDHAPNPRHVILWASRMGYVIDEISFELMIGRWELESGEGRYDAAIEKADVFLV